MKEAGVIILLAALVAPALGSSAAEARDAASPRTPNATTDVQALAKGRVLDGRGNPAPGVRVSVFALPNETAESHLRQGDTGQLERITQVRTDGQGRFHTGALKAALRQHRDAAGNINMLIRATGSDRSDAVITAGLLTEEGAGRGRKFSKDSAPEDAALVPVEVSDLVLQDTQQESRAAEMQHATGSVRQVGIEDPFYTATGVNPVGDSSEIVACSCALVNDHGTAGVKPVWVGTIHVTTPGVMGDMSYENGASTTTGVGASGSGSFGSFTPYGTRAVSTTSSIDLPATGYRVDHYVGFRFGTFGYFCDPYPEARHYREFNRYFAGGNSVRYVSTSPNTPYCVSQTGGTTFTQSTSQNATWSAGAKTGSLIGIDLSSQTGYSSTAKMWYTFSSAHRLCGAQGYPGNAPGILVARP